MPRERVVDGDWTGEGNQVPIVDMGAYEMHPNDDLTVWPLYGDVNWDCQVNILDLIWARNRLYVFSVLTPPGLPNSVFSLQ